MRTLAGEHFGQFGGPNSRLFMYNSRKCKDKENGLTWPLDQIRLPQEIFPIPPPCLHFASSIHSQAGTAVQTQGAQLSNRGSPFCLLFGCMALHLNPSQRKKFCSRGGILSEKKSMSWAAAALLLSSSVSDLRIFNHMSLVS